MRKVVSWNVNSVTVRLERLLGFLQRHQPDVVCLQETKTEDAGFPSVALREAGYHSETFGQKGYNGVALLSRKPLTAVERGFSANPLPHEARVISADVDGIWVINAYVINGKSTADPKYRQKLAWLDALSAWIAARGAADAPIVLAGDFNITADDRDVHDPKYWRGRLLCSEPERQRLNKLMQWGFTDLLRCVDDRSGIYTWWDYRFGAFKRDQGLRIDMILATARLAALTQSVEVDRSERDPAFHPSKPSDHAPVIATLGAVNAPG